jgi:hypothetical protein
MALHTPQMPNRKNIMTSKNNKATIVNETINSFCSQEQLVKFLNTICVVDFSFMKKSVTGRIKEVGPEFILLEMRDGRLLCARIDCVQGFGMVKNQPAEAI